ncbi:LacI family DNA-binding transcriptional regulator [Acuticoccus sp. M5D2P5]|uniref:LacI family DNA-binding transcriptional regulator n=1 Tax=Acuticoccus kalidii TaxID=2910977 RepID=UPI001F187173|nr:LacI family DNA-binding transcriptional regulator [Acuticoccus kalidii]MCF3936111.1 LacI family DNA-binding transcriptional regulator [Acuticoccus kalidii]
MTDDPAGKPPRQRVRLLEVAEEAGVSRAAASLALRHHPSIPAATRQRIEAAARKLGYVYNRGAASLRTASTHTVGIIVHDVTNPYFAEIVATIQDEMSASGRVVLFGNTQESPERQREFIDTFREYNVDGIVLCPAAGTDPEDIRTVHRSGLPVVLFSRDLPELSVDYVGGANRDGMRLITEHLVALGHRRIAMIGVNETIATGRDRLRGYEDALLAAGIEPDPALMVTGPATRMFGMEAMSRLMERDVGITAVAAFNDVLAFGAMLGLRQRGLEPGIDVSVTGFDDLTEARMWSPQLTTVGFSREALGQGAASLLRRRIAAPDAPPQRIVIDTTLTIRASSQFLREAVTGPA